MFTMWHSISQFFAILLCVSISYQRSTPDSDSYVAAVLEYQFTRNTTQNLQNYLNYIRQAAEQDADVLVFPEMTLTRGVSVEVPINGALKVHPIPALMPDMYDEILVSLSKAARQHSLYLVVNLQEKMDCKNAPGEFCPEHETYMFNTNVVFDRRGAVIDRYRKINLFGEYTRWPALKPDLGVFTTDFGVTFGHFICFDLMFQVPSIQVVQKYNLSDVIFSTMWFSEIPFLTAIQIQEAYAHTMDVNFLAAGANNVKVGSAGSGIYAGKDGALISIMPGDPKTKLLVTRVLKHRTRASNTGPGPIHDDSTSQNTIFINKDLTLQNQVSRLLNTGFQEFTLVDKDVSCRFTIRMKSNLSAVGNKVPRFRAFVKDGINTYASRQLGVMLCAVVACEDDSASSCPYRFDKDEANIEFEELEIEMTSYPNQYNNTLGCENVIYFPLSLQYNKFPLSAKDFTYTKHSLDGISFNQNGDYCEQDADEINNRFCSKNMMREILHYKITKPQSKLISFAVWGRMYLRDVSPERHTTEEDIKKYIEIENTIYQHAENTLNMP